MDLAGARGSLAVDAGDAKEERTRRGQGVEFGVQTDVGGEQKGETRSRVEGIGRMHTRHIEQCRTEKVEKR